MVAFLMTRVQVGDYDAWREMFERDPVGVRAKSTGHRVFRLVEDPNEVIVLVEFETPEDAAAARDSLIGSGVLERVTVTGAPTLAVEA